MLFADMPLAFRRAVEIVAHPHCSDTGIVGVAAPAAFFDFAEPLLPVAALPTTSPDICRAARFGFATSP